MLPDPADIIYESRGHDLVLHGLVLRSARSDPHARIFACAEAAADVPTRGARASKKWQAAL